QLSHAYTDQITTMLKPEQPSGSNLVEAQRSPQFETIIKAKVENRKKDRVSFGECNIYSTVNARTYKSQCRRLQVEETVFLLQSHILLQSKDGSIVAASGDMSKICDNNTTCSSDATIKVNFVSKNLVKRLKYKSILDEIMKQSENNCDPTYLKNYTRTMTLELYTIYIMKEAFMNNREFLSNNKEFKKRVPICDQNKANKEEFLDASNVAYAAAVYVLNQENKKPNSFLIYAKSPIAPLKGISVSRLELLFILIGARTA
ncbi:unnamed protein product, partial [Onchocerca ochengi]